MAGVGEVGVGVGVGVRGTIGYTVPQVFKYDTVTELFWRSATLTCRRLQS
jgi:hypothetical protein